MLNYPTLFGLHMKDRFETFDDSEMKEKKDSQSR